jgi:hypothetical protein
MGYLQVVSSLAGTAFGFLMVLIGFLWSYVQPRQTEEEKIRLPELQVGRLIISLVCLSACMVITLVVAACDLPDANRYLFFPRRVAGLSGIDLFAIAKVLLLVLFILGLLGLLKALHGFLKDIASFAGVSIGRSTAWHALWNLFRLRK